MEEEREHKSLGLCPLWGWKQEENALHLETATVIVQGPSPVPISFSTGLSVQMKVEQSPGVLTLQEGRNSSLICNFSISIRSVQWFQQNPDGRLISLFYIASGMQQKGRLKSTINSKERYSQLYIRDSQPGDSATYFCAVEAQCSADTCSLYTKP